MFGADVPAPGMVNFDSRNADAAWEYLRCSYIKPITVARIEG